MNFLVVYRSIVLLLFSLPALLALISQGWRGETGSLAPIVLFLGGWTVYQTAQQNSSNHTKGGSLLVWLLSMIVILPLYWFSQAIEMVALMALSAWLGLVACLYVWCGARTLMKSVLPICLTGLAIPMPYTLSSSSTAWLRKVTSEFAVKIGDLIGLDVALGPEVIFLGPYSLSVENACAGTTSMLSLISIGILYAYWFRANGKIKTTLTVFMAIPIAFASNLLRVVLLLIFVNVFGVEILGTVIHPASGIISFSISILFLLIWSKLLQGIQFKELVQW